MPTFDHLDPALLEDPYPVLARARRESPVSRHPHLELWSLFRHDDIQRALLDPATFSSAVRDGLDADGVGRQRSFSASDPPAHERLRGLVSKAFTARRVNELETRIRSIVRGLLDDAFRGGPVEIVEAFSFQLPMIVIAELFGISQDDRFRLWRWSDDITESQFQGIGGRPIRAESLEKRHKALGEAVPFFYEVLEQRRADPRDDLMTSLMQAEEAGDKLDLVELLSTIGLLLIAGNETTRHLISNAIVLLSQHPDSQQALRADPSLVPGAVEEVLRYESSVTVRMRRTTHDVVLHDTTIPAESTVLWWISSANRDEAVFADPDRFDIGRSPNRHLSLGHGRHFCLGAHLARLEVRIALEEILERTRAFRVVGDARPIRSEPFGFRGPKKLWIEVDRV